MSHKNYTEALLEEMNGKFDSILEIVVPMGRELTEVKRMTDKIPGMEADIKIIKLALKETNKKVQDHEHRITALEAA